MDGEARHLAQPINFAVVAKVPIEQLREHAASRGWRHARLLSSGKNTYNVDYQGEAPDGSQIPNANVFVRKGGAIHHFWSSELFHAPTDPGMDPRHVDFLWQYWSVLDRTPRGRGTNHPALVYPD